MSDSGGSFSNSDISNLCFFSVFYLVNLARYLSFIDLFIKPAFSVTCLFVISLVLIFIISFLLLSLDLICSSFSCFLSLDY